MSKMRAVAAAMMAAALLTGTAYAANNTVNTTNNANGNTKAANQDFGKLSQDGFSALRDIRLTRLAIFDGNIDQAKQDIENASNSLQKAQTDDSIFTKAESDLKTPAGMAPQTKTGETADTTPVKWLPVDGAFALGEDYLATPEKNKAVSSADTQMKQGNHDQAMDTLKLAHVNVLFDVEVAPLEKTIAGVNKAKSLIDNGQYFEANQALKNVESGMRYDVQDFLATPEPAKTAKAG
jgi:TolA-binding protein